MGGTHHPMKYVRLGKKWPETIGRVEHYFRQRMAFLDCRGHLEIAETVHFGYGVMVLTASHKYDPETTIGDVFRRRVVIEDHAWVASRATLYHCRIGHHAIVGVGAVVRKAQVPPYTMVEGNPAKIIMRYSGGYWQELSEPQELMGY
jgi:maltose O-acetyltransferase